MIISTCLAYTDLNAEFRQQDETFVVALRSRDADGLLLTLSYPQVQSLAEGLLFTLGQADAETLLKSKHNYLFGDMTIQTISSEMKGA